MKRWLLLILSAVLARAQAPPAGFQLPPDLEIKPGSISYSSYDREIFDVRAPGENQVARVPLAGKTWRFIVRSLGRPMGTMRLEQTLRLALGDSGWTLESRDKTVAKRSDGDRRQMWVRAAAVATGELRVVLVEKGDPRVIDLPQPGPLPELPKGAEDFSYLPPWPGARITASAVSRSPVDVKMPDGKERIVLVNWIDKEYALENPPSVYEFIVAYQEALTRAGWELEGTLKGATIQLQASFLRGGRNLKATLRLVGDAMGISVADVGAQIPPAGPEQPRKP